MSKEPVPTNADFLVFGNPSLSSKIARVARLARKELREILRDRRTIVTLIAMPLLLYPLISVAFQQLSLARDLSPEIGQGYRMSALTAAEERVFYRRFKLGQKIIRAAQRESARAAPQSGKQTPTSEIVWDPPTTKPTNDQERAQMLLELKEKLKEGKIDLVVVIPNLNLADDAKENPTVDQFLPCELYYAPNSPIGLSALSYVRTIFAAINEQNLKQRLNAPDVSPRINVLHVQAIPLEGMSDTGVITLSSLVPLILILMTITGAVYPAIDLTAGERERGTLEILVAAPVSRFELLAAKYITVVTVAVLNAIINLGCMAVTVSWSGLGPALIRDGELSFTLFVQIFALLILFAAFFSAVLLCLTSFARSFKEAQAYLIPLMLASLAPGIMAMMPGLKLQGILAVLPLVNIVLMTRDLFQGEVQPTVAAIVIVMTLLYALAALALAARVFGAENVLYSEQSNWSDLLRRPAEPQPAATIQAALWCLALMVPIQFSVIALLRMIQTIELFDPVKAVFLGAGFNVLLFGMVPLFFLWLGRVQPLSGLGLSAPRPAAWLAGLLLGVGLWPLELTLLLWLAQTDVAALTEAPMEMLKQARASIGWGVLIVVVVPAILEEFFFRGLLFGALQSRCSPWLNIGVTGLLFGMTHVVLGGALGLERIIPSTLLGLILGAVRWRAGSVWPGMILHVCHNAILLAYGLYEPGTTHEIRWYWLVGGAFETLLAGGLLWQWGGARNPS